MAIKIVGHWIVVVLIIPVLGYSQGAEIKGRIVTSILEKPFPQATVRIKGAYKQELFAVNGIYGFSKLPAGSYIVSASVYGYTTQRETLTVVDSSTVTLDFKLISSECPTISEESAERDIQAGTAKLMFGSGIAGYRFTDDDRDFEEEYGVKFVDFGCVIPGMACIGLYNRTIMAYLDKKYGNDWRDDISVPAFAKKGE